MSEQRDTVWCRLRYTWGDRLKQIGWAIAAAACAALLTRCDMISVIPWTTPW